MRIKLTHWQYRYPPKKFGRFGKTLYRDYRHYWVWIGQHCVGIEFHGMGPNP